jgi:hypothetical protein
MSIAGISYANYHDRIREERNVLPCIILHFDTELEDIQLWFWWVAVIVVPLHLLTSIAY